MPSVNPPMDGEAICRTEHMPRYHMQGKKTIKKAEFIKKIIQKQGPVPFIRFMEICLYDEDAGYYSTGEHPVGKKGDFVTGPSSTSLFGALISNQIREFRSLLEKDHMTIVEMGAGSAILARDLLEHLDRKEGDRFRYVIVEPFETVRSFQKCILGPMAGRVTWVETLDELTFSPDCFLSNELIDAFPVHVVQKGDTGFQEVHVCLDEKGELQECLRDITDVTLQDYVSEMPMSLPTGYRTEVNMRMKAWIQKVASLMNRGFIITIDYGFSARDYFHPARNRGTLLSFKNHAVRDNVLLDPGDQDITAHVNFSDLHRWGEEAGLVTLGFAPQWSFLASLDFEETFYEMSGGKFDPFSPMLAGVKMLILPQGMGETHKVLVQAKGMDANTELMGFRMRNIRKKL